MRWLLLACAGCSFSAGLPGTVPDDGDPGGEPPIASRYRRSLDVTDALVTGTHASFPMLVELEGSWLADVSNGGHVARTDGGDLRFSTDPDGNAVVPHEIEVYMPAQGKLVAWIGVPSLAPSTVLYLHYGDTGAGAPGDARALWTAAGFAGVWHLQPPTTDATGNSSTFVDVGSQVTNGRIAAARVFDGIDDYIEVGSGADIDDVFANGGTVEAWFRATSYGEAGAGRLLVKGPWLVTFASGVLRFFYDWTGGDADYRTPRTVSLAQWHHVAIAYDRNAPAAIYLDGALATETNQSPTGTPFADDGAALRFGNPTGGDRAFDGIIDEVRISSVTRDAGWIATSYENQRDPAGFVTLGAEELR